MHDNIQRKSPRNVTLSPKIVSSYISGKSVHIEPLYTTGVQISRTFLMHWANGPLVSERTPHCDLPDAWAMIAGLQSLTLSSVAGWHLSIQKQTGCRKPSIKPTKISKVVH